MNTYEEALANAEAAEQAISHLAERLVVGAPLPPSQMLPAARRRPTASEIRSALDNWDQARRETRRAFRELKATGASNIPEAPNLRARHLGILKKAASLHTFKTMQSPELTPFQPMG